MSSLVAQIGIDSNRENRWVSLQACVNEACSVCHPERCVRERSDLARAEGSCVCFTFAFSMQNDFSAISSGAFRRCIQMSSCLRQTVSIHLCRAFSFIMHDVIVGFPSFP